MIEALLQAMAAEGEALSAAAQAIGGSITFDPRVAISRDATLNLQPPGLWSPNRKCRMVQAADGWVAVNLARDEDRDAVPAWIGCGLEDEPWQAIIDTARKRTRAELLAQAHLLGMPVAGVGEVMNGLPHAVIASKAKQSRGRSGLLRLARNDESIQIARPLNALKALDLSALWAGPYCGGLLAQAGVNVTKVGSPTRPDPTPHTTPELNQRLNGGKKHLTMSLTDPTLIEQITTTDVLITSARPHALARLGLTPEALLARNPRLIWVAITAYGWEGDAAMRVGFGDDCAAAGGLIEWHEDEPRFIGDALADPLTGMTAATAVLEALASGQYGLFDIPLASTAARFAALIGA